MRLSAAYQEQANARTDNAQACGQTMVRASDDHDLNRQFKSNRHTRADETGSSRFPDEGLAALHLGSRIIGS